MQEGTFKKRLNLLDSTALVVGSMIGSGIFIVSGDIARNLGSPAGILLAWILGGLLTITAALCYGELAAMFPNAGGQYVYLREAYNPLVGFLFGWTLFMVIQTGTIAAVAVAFAKFLGVLVPEISTKNYVFELWSFHISTAQVVAISLIVLLTIMHTRGIEAGKIIQNFFTFSKVFVLLVFIAVGLFWAKNDSAFQLNTSIFWKFTQIQDNQVVPLSGMAVVMALGVAMVGSLFSSDAWNNITFTGAEVINPKRNIPMSLFLGTALVTGIYLLANWVYILAMPVTGIADGGTVFERGMQFATDDRIATAAISGIFGEYAAVIMAILVMISTFGCNNGLILSGARVYYAMAVDKLFFQRASQLNKKGVPAWGLFFQGIWACVLCLSGMYGDLLDYVIFTALGFYVLTIFGIFILRIKRKNIERPYKALAYPFLPALYILTTVGIMTILLLKKPEFTFPGLIIVLLGIPVFYLWKYKRPNND